MIECRIRRTKKKQESGDLDARGGKVAGTDQVQLGYRLSGLGFDSGDLSGVCQVNIPPVGLILSLFLAICNSFEIKTEAHPSK